MHVSLKQAAEIHGKSVRQMRYLIQQKKMAATKIDGRWMVDIGERLPNTARQRKTERKERQLRGLMEDALEVSHRTTRRYSVLDLKAFQIALPLFRQALEDLGEPHAVTQQLRKILEELAKGCHRYDKTGKIEAYQEARDAASRAVCELVLCGPPRKDEMIHGIEQELMASLAGLLRRLERRRTR